MLGGGGGALYLKSKVFSRKRRRREAMLGGLGACSPGKFLIKMVQFGAFWCILWPILAFITLLFLRLSFFLKKMLPLTS